MCLARCCVYSLYSRNVRQPASPQLLAARHVPRITLLMAFFSHLQATHSECTPLHLPTPVSLSLARTRLLLVHPGMLSASVTSRNEPCLPPFLYSRLPIIRLVWDFSYVKLLDIPDYRLILSVIAIR